MMTQAAAVSTEVALVEKHASAKEKLLLTVPRLGSLRTMYCVVRTTRCSLLTAHCVCLTYLHRFGDH